MYSMPISISELISTQPTLNYTGIWKLFLPNFVFDFKIDPKHLARTFYLHHILSCICVIPMTLTNLMNTWVDTRPTYLK